MFGVGFQMQMRESSLAGTWACQFGFRAAPWPFSLNPNRGTGRGTHAAQAGADAEAHPGCSTRSKCWLNTFAEHPLSPAALFRALASALEGAD